MRSLATLPPDLESGEPKYNRGLLAGIVQEQRFCGSLQFWYSHFGHDTRLGVPTQAAFLLPFVL